MRYHEINLHTNTEMLKASAKIRLNDYSYGNPVAGMNAFMFQNLKNNIGFVAYRQENEKTLLAVFSYDDCSYSYEEAYDNITDILRNTLGITRISESEDITMHQFLECLLEAKRRDCVPQFSKLIDVARLWIYEYDYIFDEKRIHFTFDERIISKTSKTSRAKRYMVDETVKKELANIEAHAVDPDFSGNVAHYVLATHGLETVMDIAETLGESLLRANRISSRRLEIISRMAPDCFSRGGAQLEEIIENNRGGIVVFDLTEKFACDPVDYGRTCQFIEGLVKRYRNQCLFLFSYNMDHPGFSYTLIPKLKKYVIPVFLREGEGGRKEATNYLKELIRASELSKYANQAAEYMKEVQGDRFTQTDIMEEFTKFEPWCLNRNIFKSYGYDVNEEFQMDRTASDVDPYGKLQNMIGLRTVKEQIDRVIASDVVEKERKKSRGRGYESRSMHMIFSGAPGTAKTTVAKLFAKIAKEKGILKSGAFVERGGMDLCGMGFNIVIRDAFAAADGGVLFIDEAYAMQGKGPISVLIQEMENQRENVIVILAGYGDSMKEFLKQNEGLKSRIPHIIDFPSYTPDELTDIFRMMVKDKGFTVTEDAVITAREILEKEILKVDFGNGRDVRNLVERAIENQAVRLCKERKDGDKIDQKVLFHITKEDISEVDEGLREAREPGAAWKELDEMIGLSNAKAVIHKAVSFFKLQKKYLEEGIYRERPAMHMVFSGNPGTAKTTVARLFGEIMKDEKILPCGQFVEVGRADLVGVAVGHTARIVKQKFKEARGGVLFIDEAYSLCDAYESGYGDEAIDTIVQEMENHREDTVVIFAGYTGPMQAFLERNPGMMSRIAFRINFDDYSLDEMSEIAKLMVSKKSMTITDAALEKVRTNLTKIKKGAQRGNGRAVRQLLEEAEMNLSDRLIQLDPDTLTREMISTIDVEDISDEVEEKTSEKEPMGFRLD